MVRKLTGSLLLCLMMVMTITSQAGVMYCLCLETVSLGKCSCDTPTEKSEPTTCSDHCCDEGEALSGDVAEDCGCTVELELDIDDFVLIDVTDRSEQRAAADADLSAGDRSVISPSAAFASSIASRAPPCVPISASVPIYLQHSVFRI